MSKSYKKMYEECQNKLKVAKEEIEQLKKKLNELSKDEKTHSKKSDYVSIPRPKRISKRIGGW